MRALPSSEIYDALLALCYESVVDDARWSTLLAALASFRPSAQLPDVGGQPSGGSDDDHAQPFLNLQAAIDVLADGKHGELPGRVAPHLDRARRLFEIVSGLREDLRRRDLLLDSLPTPLWLLDEQRRVAYRNAAAMRYAAEPDSALCEQGGYVRPRRATTGRLETAIREALGRAGPARSTHIASGSASGAEIIVAPLPAPEPDTARPHTLGAVSVLDPAVQSRHLAQLFQFSPAEARLASGLQQGMSLADYARSQGVAISTVRTQLRSLFMKTGTDRQGELVSLLMRLSRQ
ncbi:MAG: helix-turn-helix transcriptional regulator [Pigmentiphaga sp.]|uniref:helix-turn-helix transcriptional regulator n=1 Tax=Pigmentiphaga sp. TaxID=1977564 RepID=UPI0029A703FA|nr:helix-turn-helix transcriptional regulator [Pigmentiphaga sp.]MDX3906950.1 helix-turn-helix transcriptional regulator [Pigmentiphaga sp.]